MASGTLIQPHGGTLVNRLADSSKAKSLVAEAAKLPRITLSAKQACDLEMIAIGAFSPLTGFVGSANFECICRNMSFAKNADDGIATNEPRKPRTIDDIPKGRSSFIVPKTIADIPQGRSSFRDTAPKAGPREWVVWPIPITLAVDDDTKARLNAGGRAALYHSDGTLLAIISITEIYPHDKKLEIPNVFRTEDGAHPGVKQVMEEGNWLVAGPIDVITVTPEVEPGEQFTEYRLPPAQTRDAFKQRGWKTVVAFQTRNPIHRAHEYLTKCAQEICDGLLIHPLVGETKPGDIPADVRMACYKVLLDNYYVKDRTVLSVMPAAMRYAGPREAILHAIVRQNYGCSHFIVGRDHAGVGNYYGTYDAQTIFDDLKPGDLAITPLKFEHSSWCKTCEAMTSSKTCPHGNEHKVFLSGTKVRELLEKGQRPPMEFSRPEVADILIESSKPVAA